MMVQSLRLHRRLPQGCLALGLSCVLVGASAHASDLSAKADEIATLRAEVARMAEEVSTREEAHRMRLRSLETQRADLELQIRRAEAQTGALTDALATLAEETEAPIDDALLQAKLVASAPALRETMLAGLPFRVDERLADFDDLVAQIKSGKVTPGQGAARLWAWVEDERRLSRENGVDRQTITLDGREVMVEVARLGMVALFYRTPTGQVGRAVKTEGDWTWSPMDDRDDRSQVNELFSALTRGVRTGWFELPGDWMEAS